MICGTYERTKRIASVHFLLAIFNPFRSSVSILRARLLRTICDLIHGTVVFVDLAEFF